VCGGGGREGWRVGEREGGGVLSTPDNPAGTRFR